jgi:hypothetical protein
MQRREFITFVRRGGMAAGGARAAVGSAGVEQKHENISIYISRLGAQSAQRCNVVASWILAN